jgi:Holliday junction resolvasome RuvABC DNA-binding subunit
VIARLRGKLAEKEPSRVVIDVSGVGYEVFVPLTTFTAMPDAGNDVSSTSIPTSARTPSPCLASRRGRSVASSSG